MEATAPGGLRVAVTFENLEDLMGVDRGRLEPESVRRVEVPDALIDQRTTALFLPPRLVAQLGLTRERNRQARTNAGPVTLPVYSAVRLTIQGRDCVSEVIEVADDSPVCIGRVPLLSLDFVVDSVGQRLIGNPAHGGEQMFEMY